MNRFRFFPGGSKAHNNPRLEVWRQDLEVLVDAPEVVLADLTADVLHDEVDRHRVVPVRLCVRLRARVRSREG